MCFSPERNWVYEDQYGNPLSADIVEQMPIPDLTWGWYHLSEFQMEDCKIYCEEEVHIRFAWPYPCVYN